MLNAAVEVGHYSTGWCNLANITFRSGGTFSFSDANQVPDDAGLWKNLVVEMQQILRAHGIDIESEKIRLSPMLEMDVQKETFVGSDAESANRYLKREYRAPYVVPDLT